MEQIGQAIASINEAGNQSVAGTRQVEREVKHLEELALKLKRLVQADATNSGKPNGSTGRPQEQGASPRFLRGSPSPPATDAGTPPGLLLAVLAHEIRPDHHHVVLVDGLLYGFVGSERPRGQQLPGRLDQHRDSHTMEHIDVVAAPDERVGRSRRAVSETPNSSARSPANLAESSRLVCPPHWANRTASLTKVKEFDWMALAPIQAT